METLCAWQWYHVVSFIVSAAIQFGAGRRQGNYGAGVTNKRMFIAVPFAVLKNWKQPKCSEIINEMIMCPLKHVIIIKDLVFEEYLMPCKEFSQCIIK